MYGVSPLADQTNKIQTSDISIANIGRKNKTPEELQTAIRKKGNSTGSLDNINVFS